MLLLLLLSVWFRLLHYKLYLVCKIEEMINRMAITPEQLKEPRFKDFWEDEKEAVDKVRERNTLSYYLAVLLVLVFVKKTDYDIDVL